MDTDDKLLPYIKNEKIRKIYGEIRKLGITILPSEYTESIANDSLCRTSFVKDKKDTWEISVINNPNLSDSILCHELMHFIIMLEGIPTIQCFYNIAESHEWYMFGFINNLVQHLEVWKLTSLLGFSETERYDLSIRKELIPLMKKIPSAVEPSMNPGYLGYGDLVFLQACYTAAGLLSPCYEETKKILQEQLQTYAQVIVPAVEYILSSCRKNLPLTPESAQACLLALVAPLGPPQGSLTFVNPMPKILPGYRQTILDALSA